MLCWVDRAESHPRAGPSSLQSLEETLRDWGLSQLDDIISSLEKWAKTALQAIMDHQSELEVTKKGGLHARTDLIEIMASQSVALFSVILRIICIAHVHSAPITCGLQRTLVENSHSLMENMGGRFPLECLPHNVAIEFPTSAFQTGNATETLGAERAVYETLKFIDTLFENNSPPTTWNTENLDAFQNIIYRQIVESKCIKSGTPQGDFHIRESELKTYFAQVAELKDLGVCGWEVVRKELLSTFQFILQNNSVNFI
ncbi:uncharacterized protein LOC125295602 [Alosa alosa]|uniref:uncharacterized protein LOC125295602 n=1 Tax=Alosa alosa TaxID=278164 RepID=UPI0020154271|nr:uncharacterized protein LOC125295602 [Alosa alosa]